MRKVRRYRRIPIGTTSPSSAVNWTRNVFASYVSTVTDFWCEMRLAWLGTMQCVLRSDAENIGVSRVQPFFVWPIRLPTCPSLAAIKNVLMTSDWRFILARSATVMPCPLPPLAYSSSLIPMIVSGSMIEWHFWWRDVDIEVRRRAQRERRLIVPWHCVNILVIFP